MSLTCASFSNVLTVSYAIFYRLFKTFPPLNHNVHNVLFLQLQENSPYALLCAHYLQMIKQNVCQLLENLDQRDNL